MHAPVVELQQAPCPQGLGEQTAPAPWKVVPAAHAAAFRATVQAPVLVLQQAPPQGFGVQALLAP